MQILIDGLKINYQVFGEGKPFLILHGWGSNIDRWEKISDKIADGGYKVVTVDMPGFGKSDVPEVAWGFDDYIAWIEKFTATLPGFEKDFYLLGHSFGGTLSIIYAVKHPEKIRKLFLVSSAGIRKKTFKKTILADIAGFTKNFKNIPLYGVARKAFYKYFVGRTDYLTVKESMKDTYLKIIQKDFSALIPKIIVPTIIIWGDKDNITMVEDAYYMENVINGAKLIIIPGAGHDLNIRNSESVAKEVLNNI